MKNLLDANNYNDLKARVVELTRRVAVLEEARPVVTKSNIDPKYLDAMFEEGQKLGARVEIPSAPVQPEPEPAGDDGWMPFTPMTDGVWVYWSDGDITHEELNILRESIETVNKNGDVVTPVSFKPYDQQHPETRPEGPKGGE